MALNIDIITVSFRSESLLKANYELVCRLNPGADFRWIIVNNSPPDFHWAVDDRRNTVIAGDPNHFSGEGYRSRHHAAARRGF